ncbi:hypothetical protein [Bradyrhizobium sp. CCBAU 21359]|uniref:hypothetical protein n=1 Tax=Bradyrhizobium sp. CCBAU 21359 TaxID=1325080 RepID=UPI0023056077|nr:hypothetical protein [Bradyrhizobium sp. CCBAU 21359]
MIWLIVSVPVFWPVEPGREAARRIAAGARFKRGVLEVILEQLKPPPAGWLLRSDLAHSSALISVRVSDEALAGNNSDFDSKAKVADRRVRSALELSPADSILWLMLYSLTTSRVGFDTDDIRLLEQSYSSGPLEGGVATSRNRISLAVFSLLDNAMQQRTISEFAAIVDSGLIEDAASILASIGWNQRDRLLAGLSGVGLVERELLAKRLAREGLIVAVPGIQLDERFQR